MHLTRGPQRARLSRIHFQQGAPNNGCGPRRDASRQETTHSVGLTVAPESGAYTLACIDLLTFQEELAYYIYLGRRHTLSAFW